MHFCFLAFFFDIVSLSSSSVRVACVLCSSFIFLCQIFICVCYFVARLSQIFFCCALLFLSKSELLSKSETKRIEIDGTDRCKMETSKMKLKLKLKHIKQTFTYELITVAEPSVVSDVCVDCVVLSSFSTVDCANSFFFARSLFTFDSKKIQMHIEKKAAKAKIKTMKKHCGECMHKLSFRSLLASC